MTQKTGPLSVAERVKTMTAKSLIHLEDEIGDHLTRTEDFSVYEKANWVLAALKLIHPDSARSGRDFALAIHVATRVHEEPENRHAIAEALREYVHTDGKHAGYERYLRDTRTLRDFDEAVWKRPSIFAEEDWKPKTFKPFARGTDKSRGRER